MAQLVGPAVSPDLAWATHVDYSLYPALKKVVGSDHLRNRQPKRFCQGHDSQGQDPVVVAVKAMNLAGAEEVLSEESIP